MRIAIKAGDKYNKLTAIKFSHKDKNFNKHWLFRCSCRKEKIIRADHVISGHTKSCGCLYSESKITHGMNKIKIYNIWFSMKDRCSNKNHKFYNYYGGRGITVCKEWSEFENFYRDMGNRPKENSLDRIDNNGNYCKENCRWATWIEQHNNKRNNRLLTFNGKTQTIAQWAREKNINYQTLLMRINRGWTTKKSLIV